MSRTASERTIDRLRNICSHCGLPEQLVSDNDPQFALFEFKQFTKENGIRHILIALRHPHSNGQAERFKAIFKQPIKAGSFNRSQPSSIQQKLIHFLLRYRSTPSMVTGMTPAELFLKRKIRTRLDLLRPSFERTSLKHALQRSVTDGSRNLLVFNLSLYRGGGGKVAKGNVEWKTLV